MIRKFILICLLVAGTAFAEDFEVEDFSSSTEPSNANFTDTIERLEHKINMLEKKLKALAEDVEYRCSEGKNSTKTAPQPSKAKKTNAKDAKVQFEEALFLLQDQKYDEAEEALTKFIADYPNNAYTGNAYYWLGESFMQRKRYDKASLNFLQSFSKFPKNDKADLSMLKLASSLKLLGKKKESCAILAKLKAKNSSLNQSMQNLLQKELKQSKCGK